jgi:hypothetical protein
MREGDSLVDLGAGGRINIKMDNKEDTQLDATITVY